MSMAVFTIAQDELDLLPLWLAHYRHYAPDASLYVLNHDSMGNADWYLRSLGWDGDVTVVPVHHADSFNYDWLARVVEDFSAFLLRSHDTVGFSEVDELLLPAPDKYATLHELLAAVPDTFVKAQGRCVVHHHPDEPAMQWERPILAQRLHWYPSTRYSKIAFMRTPVYYTHGFHRAYNVPDAWQPHPDLTCLHLHQADYQTTLRRHQRNGGRVWSPEFHKSDTGVHQRLENPNGLQKYLLCNLDSPREYAELEPIPELYKEQYTVCRPQV
jgi:hypothetical protein